jgi:hypothetical protein
MESSGPYVIANPVIGECPLAGFKKVKVEPAL